MATGTRSAADQEGASSRVDTLRERFQEDLAKWVMLFVFLSIPGIGIPVLYAAFRLTAEQYGAGKDLLNILLPVFGAWAGTVMAYYFTRKNYESAANIAQQMSADDKLRTISAKDAMIPIDKA